MPYKVMLMHSKSACPLDKIKGLPRLAWHIPQFPLNSTQHIRPVLAIKNDSHMILHSKGQPQLR
jgi:hypothetical protein